MSLGDEASTLLYHSLSKKKFSPTRQPLQAFLRIAFEQRKNHQDGALSPPQMKFHLEVLLIMSQEEKRQGGFYCAEESSAFSCDLCVHSGRKFNDIYVSFSLECLTYLLVFSVLWIIIVTWRHGLGQCCITN